MVSGWELAGIVIMTWMCDDGGYVKDVEVKLLMIIDKRINLATIIIKHQSYIGDKVSYISKGVVQMHFLILYRIENEIFLLISRNYKVFDRMLYCRRRRRHPLYLFRLKVVSHLKMNVC